MHTDIKDFKGKHLHFIGIGGCSMNGLAEIMLSRGYGVSGCDKTESNYTKRLEKMGVDISIGHDAAHISNADLIINSAAIKDDHVEMAAAREKGIPVIDRADLLGQLTKQYKNVIGVSGCHGKTTITSMLAIIFDEAKYDATVHVGGEIDFLDGGTKVGCNDMFLTEACEYVESFLQFSPTIEIVHNIDDDHLDYFRDIDHIYSAFSKYVALLPADGLLLACTDDPLVVKLAAECPCRVITYGLEGADFSAKNIEYDSMGNVSYDFTHEGENLGRIILSVPGEHNVLNSLAAVSLAFDLGIPPDVCAKALIKYHLAARRFEFYGEVEGVKIFHDYAHHPNEIKACLKAASKYPHNNLFCVFQCNSYSRAKTLLQKYSESFEDADIVLVPDIYPGREIDTGIVHAKDLVAAINEKGSKCEYLPAFADIDSYLKANWKSGDMVIALGSGDVFRQIRILFE